MLCPHCHIPLLKDYCPRCGFKTESNLPFSRSSKQQDPSQKKVFDFDDTPDETEARKVDWLKEWEEQQKGSRTAPSEKKKQEPVVNESSTKKEDKGKEEDRPADRTGTADPTGDRRKTTSRRSRPSTVEKPLIRMPPRSHRRTSPRQGALELEPLPVQKSSDTEATDSDNQQVAEEIVSQEILFSRFLSGIIDLCLPLLVGFTFVFSASWILGFDFFMADSLEWVGLISLLVFFLTSLFFFTTSQQTPGMYLTQLRLIRDSTEPQVDREDIGLSAVMIRILFFLPVILSGIGLVWSIFDPLRRCGHDFLSGTRVVPEDYLQGSS